MPIGDIQLNNEAIDRDYAGYPGANAGGPTMASVPIPHHRNA